MEDSNTTKLNQLKYETEAWKRLLDFLKQENSFAKNRLAEVTRLSAGDQLFLNTAENYLNDLLQLETIIALIKIDVNAFEKIFERKNINDEEIEKLVSKKHQIDKEMRKLEQEFKNIKSTFDRFAMETVTLKHSA
jgi:hypothetical protein